MKVRGREREGMKEGMEGETVTVGMVGGQKSEEKEKTRNGSGDHFYKELKDMFANGESQASVLQPH